MLWRVQKMAFWVLYDHAGYLIVLNVLGLATVFGPAWLVCRIAGGLAPMAVLAAALLAVLVLVGQATVIIALIDGEEFSFRRMVTGVMAFGPRALVLALLIAAALSAPVIAAGFYASRMSPAQPLAGMLLSGLCLSGAVALLMSGIYALPALIHQRGTVIRALRTSFMLAGAHPVLTPGLLLLILVQGLLLATPPGLLLLSTLPLVALVCSAYELLARHHAEIAGGSGPDEDDIYLNRGFKDILFPWKG